MVYSKIDLRNFIKALREGMFSIGEEEGGGNCRGLRVGLGLRGRAIQKQKIFLNSNKNPLFTVILLKCLQLCKITMPRH